MAPTLVAAPTKVPRDEIVARLRRRDGDACQFPGCNEPLDFTVKSGRREVTVDHWMPQWWGKENGWSSERIWDIDNLKLMHKKCNASKGDRIPNEDGTLPERPTKTFRYRRQKRAGRPELCTECDNGNLLAKDEICANCSSTAKRFPTWAKVRFQDCDHELFWCWACSIDHDMRPAAVDTAVLQGESGEW
jgi:hypothetical protein